MTTETQKSEVRSQKSEVALPGLAECWQQMPWKGAFVALLVGWVALFHWLGNATLGYVDTPSLFGWLHFCYFTYEAADDIGLIVPFFVGFLLWWRRDELLALRKAPSWWGVMLLFFALALHILGYAVQQPRISFVAFVCGLFALTGVVWGHRWLRATILPFVLLFFCTPLGDAADLITVPLRLLVTKLTVAISNHGLGIDVIREGSRIFDAQRTMQYDVAPACSGIRGLVAMLFVTTMYGYLMYEKTWRRFIMVAMAFPLAVFGNTVRITITVLIGKLAGQEAGAKVEQNLGFITFAAAIIAMLIIGHFLRERKKGIQRENSECRVQSAECGMRNSALSPQHSEGEVAL